MRKLSFLTLVLALAACQPAANPDQEAPTPAEPEQPAMEQQQEPAEAMASAEFSGQYSEIDEESSFVNFEGNSSIVDHTGTFQSFDANLTLSGDEPANLEQAMLEIMIDVDSVKTDSGGLDGHLQREDFFDAENYPQITFKSTSIESKGDNMYAITGDMSMKGTTKTMTIDAEITDEKIVTSFNIPRKDFGVGNDSYGDKLLDEEVPVTAEFMFVQ